MRAKGAMGRLNPPQCPACSAEFPKEDPGPPRDEDPGTLEVTGEVKSKTADLRKEDEGAKIVTENIKIQEEIEIPGGEEFEETFKVQSDREGNVYLRVSIETKKRLNELKWSQEKFLMN